MDSLYLKLHRQLDVTAENINKIVSTIPLALDSSELSVQEVGNYFLPFSTGIEIECIKGEEFNNKDFTDIPDIMAVNCTDREQRFRIPNGIKGLQCLYNITRALKKNSLLNPLSGIHYHIDFTELYDEITDDFVASNKDWMLEELVNWNYKGTYNLKNITFNTRHHWVRFQEDFKTLEFRIGEMTFDYELLFRRIAHANAIVEKFKNNLVFNILEEHKLSHDFSKKRIDNTLNNRIQNI